jgi:tetrahydrodipicolinate N-succinyltransferase
MTSDARTLIEAAFAARALLREGAYTQAVLDTLEALDKGKLRELHDQIPTKHDLAAQGVRVVQPGAARYGAHLAPGTILMITGTRPKKFRAGEYGTPCALIIGMREESTDQKTSLNAALRDFGVSA